MCCHNVSGDKFLLSGTLGPRLVSEARYLDNFVWVTDTSICLTQASF